MHHENGPAGNAIARPGASRIRASSCWWPKIPLIPEPSFSSFPSVLKCRRARYIEIQEVIWQRWWGLQQPKGSPQVKAFSFSFFFFTSSSATYGWALMSTTHFLPPPRLRNKTSPPMGNRFWGCVLSHHVCVCVCFPGWWARLWPSKWARTLRTSAPQMWPTWLVGVPRLSNVVFIPTEREKKRQAIIIGAPLHLRPPDGHFFKKVKCYFIYFSLSPSVDSEHTPHWHVMASF